ncbi:hypothetical protein E4T39_08380 [Aureobasidium subglaciale]|nr:hypothetical protein E4T39_08380 [Aureobasidium subglaciale]
MTLLDNYREASYELSSVAQISEDAAALVGCSKTSMLHTLSKEEIRNAWTAVESGNGSIQYSPWRLQKAWPFRRMQ